MDYECTCLPWNALMLLLLRMQVQTPKGCNNVLYNLKEVLGAPNYLEIWSQLDEMFVALSIHTYFREFTCWLDP